MQTIATPPCPEMRKRRSSRFACLLTRAPIKTLPVLLAGVAGHAAFWLAGPLAGGSEHGAMLHERESLSMEGFPPVILRQTGDQTVLPGDRVLFFVEAGGEGDLQFTWFRNGEEIAGAEGPELLLPELAEAGDESEYFARVANIHGIAESEPMYLTVRVPLALPIGAGDHAVITEDREHNPVRYDLFLPSTYHPAGAPLPLLLTYRPVGGGMVSHFKTVASELQIIVVGVIDSRNNVDWRELIGPQHATERDLRERVNYDATAVFAAGFSGGGLASFNLAKRKHPHIAGVLSMGGWLGDQRGPMDRYQPGLIVARTYGANDTGALSRQQSDGDFLLSHGAILRDWIHGGGHIPAPESVQRAVLPWMLEQRATRPRHERENARITAARWRAEASAGRGNAVMTEVLEALMNHPRSWLAQEARRTAEEILEETDPVGRVWSSPRFGGDLAADYLFAFAYGAAMDHQIQAARGALRAFEGLVDTVGDRIDDFHEIATTFGRGRAPRHLTYPEWRAQHFGDHAPRQAPGADFSGDGIANITSYTMGLDPTINNTSNARPHVALEISNGQPMASVEFQRSLTSFATDQSLEYSRNLEEWIALDAAEETTVVYTHAVRVRVRIPLPADQVPFFLRHRVQAEPEAAD